MKVPKAKKLPSGNWNIRMRLAGEEISITRSTEAACKQEAQLVKAEHLAGKRIAVGREVSEATLQQIQKAFIKARRAVLSPSTIKGYEQMAKWRWSGYQNQELRHINWQSMINDELEKVTPKTVRNAWALVAASLRHAGYPVPKVKLAACPVHEIDFMQPDEIPLFIDEVRGKRYEIAALLLLHGLRVSEVRGLTWSNVDTKHGMLHIRGSVVEGPDGFVEKQTNKNQSSSRDVPVMIPRLSELLKDGGPPDDRIVTLCSSVILRDIKRASAHAIGRPITSHGLRHSWASAMYSLGPVISERQMMQWGGWSDIQTMHKVYIRLAAAAEDRARQAATAFFSGKQNADENADDFKKPSKTGRFD